MLNADDTRRSEALSKCILELDLTDDVMSCALLHCRAASYSSAGQWQQSIFADLSRPLLNLST